MTHDKSMHKKIFFVSFPKKFLLFGIGPSTCTQQEIHCLSCAGGGRRNLYRPSLSRPVSSPPLAVPNECNVLAGEQDFLRSSFILLSREFFVLRQVERINREYSFLILSTCLIGQRIIHQTSPIPKEGLLFLVQRTPGSAGWIMTLP